MALDHIDRVIDEHSSTLAKDAVLLMLSFRKRARLLEALVPDKADRDEMTWQTKLEVAQALSDSQYASRRLPAVINKAVDFAVDTFRIEPAKLCRRRLATLHTMGLYVDNFATSISGLPDTLDNRAASFKTSIEEGGFRCKSTYWGAIKENPVMGCGLGRLPHGSGVMHTVVTPPAMIAGHLGPRAVISVGLLDGNLAVPMADWLIEGVSVTAGTYDGANPSRTVRLKVPTPRTSRSERDFVCSRIDTTNGSTFFEAGSQDFVSKEDGSPQFIDHMGVQYGESKRIISVGLTRVYPHAISPSGALDFPFGPDRAAERKKAGIHFNGVWIDANGRVVGVENG